MRFQLTLGLDGKVEVQALKGLQGGEDVFAGKPD